MEIYILKRKLGQSSSENASDNIPQPSSTSLPPTEIDLSDLPWDPAERKKIQNITQIKEMKLGEDI